MPFFDPEKLSGPLSLPVGLDVTRAPEDQPEANDVVAAAFRQENPIASLLSSFSDGPDRPFDRTYRPWLDIQETHYEPYAARFVGARDRVDVETTKLQIDRELQDRNTLESAGWGGFVAQMGAALLSPTSLLPGGVIVKGAKGVSIAKTGLAVSMSATAAASIDEIVLHGSQKTRTGIESAVSIGGSAILGGLLGAAAGKLTKSQFDTTATQIGETLTATYELDRAVRSIGAADVTGDMTLRRENVLQNIKKFPVVGPALVGSDPLLRTMLHDLHEVRTTASRLVEPVLEYSVNEHGKTALSGAVPVETRVKTRRQSELAGLYADFSRFYGEYDRDGEVGLVGRFSAPLTGKWGHLLGKDRKLSVREFGEEVAKAMRRNDKHPIPQVEAVAELVRKNLFDRVAKEVDELGLLPEGIELSNRGSYLTRVYNVEKINQHYGDGSADDLVRLLRLEYQKKRTAAQSRLARENTHRADADRLADEDLAGRSDAELATAVDETVQAIKGLRSGESASRVGTASPTRARVLDIPDELLEPWLEPDARVIMSRYFDTMVPEIEIVREFGDLEMSDAIAKINDEESRSLKAIDSRKARRKVARGAEAARRDLLAMRDRIRGVYGLPKDPRNAWVVGGRVSRTLSYTGLLGGFMLSALPDLGSLLGRSGVEAAFGATTLVTDPKRLGIALKHSGELGAAAEWYLNGRAMEIASISDPFSAMTRSERMVNEIGRVFSFASGVVPWNAGWKTVGGAFVASRMAKAAVAVGNGKASKLQIRKLAANGIEPWMAERIGKQIDQFGDTDGALWLPQAATWNDSEAFQAFRHAMTREHDLAVITPNQDKPLAFSSEAGKFFFQFKSFAFSAHHRILLAGIQRADADTLATVASMLTLGLLVSNIQADLKGRERKSGSALWEDAIDRSGLAGWLLEIHAPANALTGGAFSMSGEEISRYRAKASFEGVLGPSYGIGQGVFEAISSASQQAAGTRQMTQRDIERISRAVPGNNLWWLLGLTDQIESQVAEALGQTD